MEEIKKKNEKIRKIMLIIAIILGIGYIFTTALNLRSEYLQYKEIGSQYVDVFWTNVKYEYIVTLINFIFIFIILYITNKLILKGLKPFFRDEKKEFIKLPNKSIAFILTLISSVFIKYFVTDKVLLFFNSALFGVNDPIYGMDVGYFFFQRPLYMFLTNYLSIVIIGISIYIVAYYIISFNVLFKEIDRTLLKNSMLFKHIKFNIIVLSIVQAIAFYFRAQNIVYGNFATIPNTSKQLLGAGITSATVELWMYKMFPILIVICVLLAIHFIKKAKYKKSIISLAILPAYIILTYIACFVFQMIIVNPNELDKEKKYINYNIQYTRQAYNLNIEEESIESNQEITLQILNQNQNVIENVPLVNENMVLKYLNEYYSQKGYYKYNNAYLAKYNIDGEEKLIYLSAREINSEDNRTYLNKRYEYTHGNSVEAVSANEVSEDGSCVNISTNELNINQPRIYFGQLTNEHVVVNANDIEEFDYIEENKIHNYNYDGVAGITLNTIDRLVMSLELGDLKMIFTNKITDKSKLLLNRNIVERAKKIAPFLEYDENPYLVINDEGNLVWVLDAYITSDLYPYSQKVDIQENNGVFTTTKKINYIRNSVKVLIDAYDGTTTFYITDKSDPVIMAYAKAYPTLFANLNEGELPDYVWNNIQYPQYLFNIQAQILEDYHETQPEIFYRNDNQWTVTLTSEENVTQKMIPYYIAENKDGELKQTSILTFSPINRKSIISYLTTTNNSKDEYGKLKMYNLSKDNSILGPLQIDSQISESDVITKGLKTWSFGGYEITREIQMVPLQGTMLYIEPVQITALNETDVPTIKKVIVASENKLAIGDTLQEGLDKLVSQNAIDIKVQNTDDLDSLINEIIIANDNLKTSFSNSDWEMFGRDMKSLQELIDKLEEMQEESDENE